MGEGGGGERGDSVKTRRFPTYLQQRKEWEGLSPGTHEMGAEEEEKGETVSTPGRD